MEYRPSLHHLIAERARKVPDRSFVQDVDGAARTYEAVHLGGLRWAGAFRRHGVAEGDIVAVMVPSRSDLILAWLGLSWLRSIELPVNTAFKGQILIDVLLASSARLVVVDAAFVDTVLEAVEHVPSIEAVVVSGDPGKELASDPRLIDSQDFLCGDPAREGDLPRSEYSDTACVIWTSGTTGPSKGTIVSWAQLHAMGEGAFPVEEIAVTDAFYCPFPLYYVGGKMATYLMARAGARIVLREQFKTGRFWDDVGAFQCTHAALNPAMARFLLSQAKRPREHDNPLRDVLVAPAFAEIDQFCERFRVRWRTAYNSTETSAPIVSGWCPADYRSCGRARPGYDVRIVDEQDRQVPAGVVGELVVRADEPWLLSSGYLGRPEATAQAWRNLWFHTGDAFRCDEKGNFYFIDRLKDAIRRRGQNISSVEVEAVVDQHSEVKECAVVAAPSEWGEDEVRVFVEVEDRDSFDPGDLHAFCAGRLPRFMVPRYVDVVDEFPRTISNKVRKHDLKVLGITADTWDCEGQNAPC